MATKQLAPPALLSTCLGTMVVLRRFLPLLVFVRPPLAWLGLVPLFGGIGVSVAALRRFRMLGTTIKPFRRPRRLVTGGVCRYTRNPMYLGEILILAGAWTLTGAVSAAFPLIVFALVADRCFVPAEEAILLKKFGRDYRDYCRRTPRWI